MKQLSDEEAVREILRGGREAYAALVDRYKGLAFGVAIRLLKDAEQAEEVVHEAFVTAYMNLDRLARPERFGPWVTVIVRNHSLDALRKRGHVPESLEALAEEGFDPPAAPAASPEHKEQVTALRKALAQLPASDRQLLELRYSEGFSLARIAAFLDVSMSAVKVRLYRTRGRVLAVLKKEGWTS